MVKLHVFGNNSKTVNNIRNLTWIKIINTGRSNYPEILKKIPSSFRGEDFFNISQSETRIALGGHICWRNGTK
jgi:hypothetical protein